MPAAIVALPLLAGALTGLVISDYTATALSIYSASGAVLALLSAAGAFSVESSLEAVVAIATGCLLAGLSLGVTSAFLAYHPPLLQWFEARPSRDPSSPILIDGVLREDASLSGPSPSLVVDVRSVGVNTADGWVSSAKPGGVRLSVGGAFGPARLVSWRAGRRVRISALLRAPSTYLDPGVRDDRRALARRGIVLVGNVKSAAMVEIVANGSFARERAAEVPVVGSRPAWRCRRQVEREVGGGRDCGADRRPHRSSRCRHPSPAGRRDVSRDRDLGREHRDSDGPRDGCTQPAESPSQGRRGHDDRSAPRLRRNCRPCAVRAACY